MYNITHVYIPLNRNRDKEEFKHRCLTNVSPYSTEITWVLEEKSSKFLVFNFFEASDAMAFKLRFGL